MNDLKTYIYIAIGAADMKAGDILIKWVDRKWGKKKELQEEEARRLANEKCVFENLDRINSLLSKQLEVNVQKYLDIMNINITLRGENHDLTEKVALMEIEIKALRKEIREFENEVEKLKKYIKQNA